MKKKYYRQFKFRNLDFPLNIIVDIWGNKTDVKINEN